jgi:hypothetical protein
MGYMATQPNPQIIAKGQWFEIHRELGEGSVKLIVKYFDRFDKNVYAERIFELGRDNTLQMRTKWNMPETRGERIIATVKLQPEEADQWRNRMLSVASVKEFERLMWELDEAYVIKAKE